MVTTVQQQKGGKVVSEPESQSSSERNVGERWEAGWRGAQPVASRPSGNVSSSQPRLAEGSKACGELTAGPAVHRRCSLVVNATAMLFNLSKTGLGKDIRNLHCFV